MSSTNPTIPTTGVGKTASPLVSLNILTLPPVTGVFNSLQASPIPRTASLKCQKISGFSGLPKFKQFVIAKGLAPEHTRFLAASLTAIIAP